MTGPTRRLVFLDTETTGLDPRVHRPWDIAYIMRDDRTPDLVRQWFVRVPLDTADPFALNVGHYWQRHPEPHGYQRYILTQGGDGTVDENEVAALIAEDLRDAIVVGACPWFDDTMLKALLYRQGLMPTWHYHLVDVETLAAGLLGLRPPWDFDTVLAKFGLEYAEEDRHTALGDAVMAARLYDAIMTGAGAVS